MSHVIETIRKLNTELAHDVNCSPKEYFQMMGEKLELAKNLGDPSLLAEIEIAIGCKYALYSKPNLTFQHFAKAEELIANALKEPLAPAWMSLMYNRYGLAYDDLLDFQNSLHNHLKALDIDRQLKNEYGIVRSLNNIGYAYLQMGMVETAIPFLKEAAGGLYETFPYVLADTYFMLGRAYEMELEYEQAKQNYYHSIDITTNLHFKVEYISQAASCCLELDDVEEAEQLIHQAKKLALSINVSLGREATLLVARSKLAVKKRQYKNAWSICEAGLARNLGFNDKKAQATIMLQQARILFEQDEFVQCQKLLTELRAMTLPTVMKIAVENILLAIFKKMRHWEKAFRQLSKINESGVFIRSQMLTLQQLIDSQQNARILQEKNAELIELHHEKDEMFRIVAHDLKNPLSAAMITIDLLAQRPDHYTLPKLQQRLERVKNSLQLMNGIISQLTTMAIAESDNNERLETIALSSLIADSVAENAGLANKKQQHLILTTAVEATVYGNRLWIKQILSNLISNAIKYSSSGATTKVSVMNGRSEEYICVEVKDEGLGLSSADLHKVFSKYGKLSALPTGNESSTGLGLYISKLLTEKMGGTISAYSEGKGKGSIFQVELPSHSLIDE